MSDVLVRTEAAADHLGVDKRWLYANQDRLKIPRYRLGGGRGALRYRLSELDVWVESQALVSSSNEASRG
jgi:predicted DNA-binding transcriptional regulator AlpA